MKPEVTNHLRIPLLILGMLSLVFGTLAGVARLGWSVPEIALPLIPHHGVLMIPAFFGAVIGLERAVAIGRLWAYAAPLFSGLGGVLLISSAEPGLPLLMLTLGSLIFVAASITVLTIQNALHNWILFIGSLGLVAGNLLLVLGLELKLSVLWWIVFLVLTIAGERLELSRLAIRSDTKRQMLAILCVATFAGAILSVVKFNPGELLVAFGVLAIALWLISYDIARRTIYQKALPRFTAICMLSGYVWLITCALLLMLVNLEMVNLTRDAPYHALFLGFVFSMVLGHALIIFPAVTRLKIPYSPVFYLPLIVLHATLVVRVSGVFLKKPEIYTLGVLFNAIALAIFIATMLYAIGLGLSRRRRMVQR